MSNLKLTAADKKKISAAVKKAESKTSGEIATAFIKQSCDYAAYELTFALIAGFIYFVTIMFFVGNIQSWIQSMFWDYNLNHLIAFYGFSTFLFISICYLLANISCIDRLIIPKKIMQRKVYEKALRHFIESGISYTRDGTGILFFISALERRVELMADTGINEKIEQKQWDDMVAHIIEGIQSDKIAEHLSDSIAKCGKLLAEFFPIKKDDTNELPDDIKILEK